MAYLKLLDLSHYQGELNSTTAIYISQNYDGVIIKATEGTTIVDPELDHNVSLFRPLESATFAVGFYHFSDAGNPSAEAQFFLNTLWPLAVGEFVCLDFEDETYANPGVWSWSFMLTINGDPRTNHLLGMEYTTRSILAKNPDGNDWTAIEANCPIWLADPGADPNAQPTYNGVPVPYPVDIEQYGEAAVPGITGLVDQDAAYFSSVTAIQKCGYQIPVSTPIPTVIPLPVTPPPATITPAPVTSPVVSQAGPPVSQAGATSGNGAGVPSVSAPAPAQSSLEHDTLMVFDFLKGKKSYLVGIIMILTALEKYLTGATTLSQFLTTVQGLTGFNGLAVITLRAALAKLDLKL